MMDEWARMEATPSVMAMPMFLTWARSPEGHQAWLMLVDGSLRRRLTSVRVEEDVPEGLQAARIARAAVVLPRDAVQRPGHR